VVVMHGRCRCRGGDGGEYAGWMDGWMVAMRLMMVAYPHRHHAPRGYCPEGPAAPHVSVSICRGRPARLVPCWPRAYCPCNMPLLFAL
jgi:hypothetical protein